MSESDRRIGTEVPGLQASDDAISSDGGRIGGLDFELLAASLRASSSDIHSWITILADKLARALPEQVQVHRAGLLKNGAVNRIEIDMGAWRLLLRLENGYPVAERIHVVRGIALKTEQLSLDDWIICLCKALSERAAAGAQDYAALQSLLE
jgi:hypothetical protein